MTGKATAPETAEALRAIPAAQAPTTTQDEVVLMGRRATDTPPRIDMVEALAEAVSLARDLAELKDVGILYAYSADQVWVRADEARLRGAFDDLLVRAVDATPAGLLAIRCMPRDGAALLEVVEVRDAEAVGGDLDAIFATATPAADDMDTVDPAGYGPLQALVQAGRGSIEIASSPRTGSRITVRLPLATA